MQQPSGFLVLAKPHFLLRQVLLPVSTRAIALMRAGDLSSSPIYI